MKKEGGRKLSA